MKALDETRHCLTKHDIRSLQKRSMLGRVIFRIALTPPPKKNAHNDLESQLLSRGEVHLPQDAVVLCKHHAVALKGMNPAEHHRA